jgi:cytochrome c5
MRRIALEHDIAPAVLPPSPPQLARPELRMKAVLALGLLVALATMLEAQQPARFPPDSLVNTQVIPRGTPVAQVIGMMRDFAGNLGVRCQFCHVGQEGVPLARFDFVSDDKRTKQVARQMMLMVQEINRRLDTIPGRPASAVRVTCATCHRGTSRPIPLSQLVADDAIAAGADSAIRAYRALRTRHYGRDAYDFGELSLSAAALRVARAARHDDAIALIRLNEEFFPRSAGVQVARGDVLLLRSDSAGAAAAFRAALARDSTNVDARSRLRDIGVQP